MASPKEQVERFLENTEDARVLSQKCRDYFAGRQWTDAEVVKLRARKQAPIVVNRIRPKVEGLLGIYEMRKSDPKAYPRTQKHEQASAVMTDGLRYVADNTNFNSKRLDVAEDFFVEGYGGVFTEIKRKGKELEIAVNQIPWDRIYFDPASRRKDFKDAKFMGILVWMYIDDVNDFLPGIRINKDNLQTESDVADAEGTTDDRPRWASKKEDRVRLAMHFEIIKGVWKMSIFSGEYEILKLEDSPYLDEDGIPMNPIELVSANVDRENNRYSEVSGFLSQQDEINHRRSKYLYQNSTRQTFGNDAAIQDVTQAKTALRDPEGHLKINGDAQFGKDFGIIPTQDMSNAQLGLYQDAKSEMDRHSFSAPLSGNNDGQELSGRAMDKLQQGSNLELNRQYAVLAEWEKRVYTQIWCRIKQFWSDEKWIRVTDDQEALRWIGLNAQITGQQFLEEAIEDESSPLESRQEAQKILQFLVQTQHPRLQEVVQVKNEVSSLDLDIIIDQSFDTVNIQQEQFEMLAQFAQGADVDIIELIELSQLRGKKQLIEKIERRRAQQAQAQQAAQEQEQQIVTAERVTKVQKEAAQTENINADTLDKKMGVVTKQIENTILVNQPADPNPQVNV